MKKITSLLMMFVLFVGMGWAQAGSIVKNLGELKPDMVYTFECLNRPCYLGVDNDKLIPIAKDQVAHNWYYYKSPNGLRYLYNVDVKRFLGDRFSKNRDSEIKATVEATNHSLVFRTSSRTDGANIMMSVDKGASSLNVNGESTKIICWNHTGGGTGFDNLADGGNGFKVVQVDYAEIASVRTKVADAVKTYEDKLGLKNSELSQFGELQSGYIYTFEVGREHDSKNNNQNADGSEYQSFLMYDANHPNVLVSSQKRNLYLRGLITEPSCQWVYYSVNGKKYLFNLAGKKFIGNVANNGVIELADLAINDKLTFKETSTEKVKAGYQFMMSADNKGVVNHNLVSATYGVSSWNGGWNQVDDGGSAHKVTLIKEADAALIADIKVRVANSSVAGVPELMKEMDKARQLYSQANRVKGEGLGFYPTAKVNNLKTQIEEATKLFAKEGLTQEDVVAQLGALKQAKKDCFFVVPEEGKFYTIQGKATSKLMDASATNATQNIGMKASSEADPVGKIFYVDVDNKLLSYAKGLYLDETCKLGNVGNSDIVSFGVSENNNGGYFTLKTDYTGSKYIYDNGNHNGGHVDRNSGYAANNCDWKFVEVTELPVVFKGNNTSGYYATIYAPVALTIPADVTAYIGKKGEGVVNLTSITTGVIPAKSAVLLKANTDGVKNFPIVYENSDAALASDFVGTIAAANRGTTAYLGLGFGATDTGVVGFYNVESNVLKGFRARLTQDGAAQANGLRLNFGEATGIESVVEALNGKAEIFDLSGRRVAAPAKGIYIVNGKKVFVK